MIGLDGAIAALAPVAAQLLADGSLAATDRLSDGFLVVSGLCHIGDYLTVVAAKAGVCVIHSQFVVKPD